MCGPRVTVFGLVLRGFTAAIVGVAALDWPRVIGCKGALGMAGAGDAGPVGTGARAFGFGIGQVAFAKVFARILRLLPASLPDADAEIGLWAGGVACSGGSTLALSCHAEAPIVDVGNDPDVGACPASQL